MRHVLLLFALLAFMAPASAHDFYDPLCCNDRDCEPIPASGVTETKSGYVVQYSSIHGNEVRGFIKKDLAKFSPDGRFHACQMPSGVRCLYVPSPST